MSKAHQHLAGMANSHESLYERILDTPGFAFHFNELALLAGEADRLRAELAEARAQLAAERERSAALENGLHALLDVRGAPFYEEYLTNEAYENAKFVTEHARSLLATPTAAHPEREVENGE